MITQRIVTTAADLIRPSCFWRCACGLPLIARRIKGQPELHYRGKKRTVCPHCKADLLEQMEGRRRAA